MLLQLLSDKGIEPYTVLSAEDTKPQSMLITSALYDGEIMGVLTVSNTGYETVSDTLVLPEGNYESIGNNGKCTFTAGEGKMTASFTLDGMESVAIIKI